VREEKREYWLRTETGLKGNACAIPPQRLKGGVIWLIRKRAVRERKKTRLSKMCDLNKLMQHGSIGGMVAKGEKQGDQGGTRR